MRGRAWGLLSIALLGACLRPAIAADGPPAAERAAAKQILEAAGVQGGLLIHLGCRNGALTAALHADGRYVVQGLDADAKHVDAARTHIQSLGLYGKVSVDQWAGGQLPYADNLVNLIVAEDLAGLAMDEVLRVLAPHGVAYIKADGKWTKTVKPRPAEIDQWTHYFHDASGNAVSQDVVVGPPRHLQWLAAPLWPRSHEYTPSLAALVSSNGRIYYIQEEGLTGSTDLRLPDRWALVARDAFNGALLWKRPLSGWGWTQWKEHGHWATPMSLPRRLVAAGDRLYVTLGYRAPLSVLDARTGEDIRACPETKNTDEIIHADGVVLVRRRKEIGDYPKGAGAWNVQVRQPGPKIPKELTELPPASPGDDTIVALKADTGEVLWQRPERRIAMLTLAACNGRVCYHTFSEIVCLDLRTGKQLWRVENTSWPDLTGTAGTLIMYQDVVLYAAERGIEAWSAVTGQSLWKGPRSITIASRHPADLFVAGGLVWGSMTADMAASAKFLPKVESPIVAPPMTGMTAQGFDPRTGEVKRKIDIGNLVSKGHHVRCYRSKATEQYLLWPKRGVEFVDITGGANHTRCDWTRGECSYGVMPANGLLYTPPHPCVCYVGVELNGFRALSATRAKPPAASDAPRLVRGPAFNEVVSGQSSVVSHYHSPLPTSNSPPSNPQPPIPNPQSLIPNPSDWPVYRHDSARSGCTKTPVPATLKQAWSARVGGKLTSPVIAGGRVFVASVDAHAVHALNAGDGHLLWSFTAGARVDSPPTVHAGLVLFGCRDGSVYCLRAADGALVWRFRAAPEDRRVLSFEQLESAWPVPGSVLVEGGVAYCAAGRSSFLDGGMYLYGLDPRSGRVIHQAHLDGPWPDGAKDVGGEYSMEGAKPDILVGDGTSLFMYHNRFDLKLKQLPSPALDNMGMRDTSLHLMATGGFLDDTWSDRFYWIYGRQWPGHLFTVKGPKAGNILVFDESTTYALNAFPIKGGLSPGPDRAWNGYDLYADSNDREPVNPKGWFYSRGSPPKWSVKVPVRARGMVLAGEKLFLAGPPDLVPEDDPYAALEGRRGARLWAVAVTDGSKLAEYPLDAPPVFDGLVAANQRLYLSTEAGTVVCWGE